MEHVRTNTKVLANSGMHFHALEISDPEKLGHILTSGLYQDPLQAVIRETLSNAWDSQAEAIRQGALPPKPISMTIDPGTSQLVIADYGTGIHPDHVRSVVMSLGGTTKDGDNTAIGGWGLGFKSPYALTSQWLFENRWNGKIHVYACAIVNDLISYSHVSTHATTQPNGVTIRIPLDADEHDRARMLTRYFTRFLDHKPDVNLTVRVGSAQVTPAIIVPNSTITVTIDGFQIHVHKLAGSGSALTPLSAKHHTRKKYSWESNDYGTPTGAILTLGGIPYELTQQDMPGLDSPFWKSNYWIQAPVGFLTPTPSRDALRTTPQTADRLARLQDAILTRMSASLYTRLKSATNPREIADIMHEAQEPSYLGDNLRSRILDEILVKHNLGDKPGQTEIDRANYYHWHESIYVQLNKHYATNKPNLLNFLVGSSTVASSGKAISLKLANDIRMAIYSPADARWGTNPSPYTQDGNYTYPGRVDINPHAHSSQANPNFVVLDDLGKNVLDRLRYCSRSSTRDTRFFFLTSQAPGQPLPDHMLDPDSWAKRSGMPASYFVLASTLACNIPAKPAPTPRASAGVSASTATNPADNEVRGTQVVYHTEKGWRTCGPVATSELAQPNKRIIYAPAIRADVSITLNGYTGTYHLDERLRTIWQTANAVSSTNFPALQERETYRPDVDQPTLVLIQASATKGTHDLAQAHWTSLDSMLDKTLRESAERLDHMRLNYHLHDLLQMITPNFNFRHHRLPKDADSLMPDWAACVPAARLIEITAARVHNILKEDDRAALSPENARLARKLANLYTRLNLGRQARTLADTRSRLITLLNHTPMDAYQGQVVHVLEDNRDLYLARTFRYLRQTLDLLTFSQQEILQAIPTHLFQAFVRTYGLAKLTPTPKDTSTS